jgi:glutaredoxin
VSKVHLEAWKQGLKGLYYLRTEAKQRAENVGDKVERVALRDAQLTTIYGKDTCPFCDKAKTWFEVRGMDYEYVNIEELGKTAAEVTGRPEVTTVPQIYIAGEYIGGYSDLVKWGDEDHSDDGNECLACEG